ncbi:hypothetical protein SARC_10345, partial [Sphaeroforma arctica JP610]
MSMVLKSNIILFLSQGARIRASGNVSDYDAKRLHLIYADSGRNITIAGYGVIDGNAPAFFTELEPNAIRLSPLIELRNIQHLMVGGITIESAPGWTLRPKNCEYVEISKIMILNDRKYVNTDGIDPDSSSHVRITDCFISAGDDAVVIKSSDYGGPPGDVVNVTVANCTLISSASALKIGTETFGNFKNIHFSDVNICNSRTGIAIMAKDGGKVEKVTFERISMHTEPKWGVGVEWPILIDVERRYSHSEISLVRDVVLENIIVNTKGRVYITGMTNKYSMKTVSLRNVLITYNGVEDRSEATMLSGTDEINQDLAQVDYGTMDTALLVADASVVDLDVIIDWSAVYEQVN